MKPDMVLSWKQHLRDGNVWRVNIELPMQDVPGGDVTFYDVDVYVVSPTQELAQYIVSTMYSEYQSISVDDEPVRTAP